MTLSLNFRSDLIPEGRSAINGLERTLGDFLLLSSPCSRFAPDCSWACKERMPKGAHQSDHFREGGIGLRGAAARSALRGGRASGTGRGQGPMSVADNLGSHKGEAVRNAIRDVGACVVFLPKILPTSTPSSRSPPSSKLCSERRERELRGISDACGKIPPAACASSRQCVLAIVWPLFTQA